MSQVRGAVALFCRRCWPLMVSDSREDEMVHPRRGIDGAFLSNRQRKEMTRL